MTDPAHRLPDRAHPLDGVCGAAVIGGPRPAPTALRGWCRAKGLRFPCVVRGELADANEGPGLVGLHDGITYLVRRSAPAGQAGWFACPDAPRLFDGLRRALLELRSRELIRLDVPYRLDWATERELRAIALQRIRLGHADWQAAVRPWTHLVANRHRAAIHQIRRKLIEFASLLTVDLDLGGDEERDLWRAWKGILACCSREVALKALLDAYRIALERLVGVCRRQLQPATDDGLAARALALAPRVARDGGSSADLARALKVSDGHLARTFRQATGRSVLTHLTGLRVARARELLAEGDDDLATVATATGFRSLRHFHRVFAAHCGASPARFRRAR